MQRDKRLKLDIKFQTMSYGVFGTKSLHDDDVSARFEVIDPHSTPSIRLDQLYMETEPPPDYDGMPSSYIIRSSLLLRCD
jgi:hypothetical protein